MANPWTNCPKCNKVMPRGAVCVNCPGKPLGACAVKDYPAIEHCRLIEKDVTVSTALLESVFGSES